MCIAPVEVDRPNVDTRLRLPQLLHRWCHYEAAHIADREMKRGGDGAGTTHSSFGLCKKGFSQRAKSIARFGELGTTRRSIEEPNIELLLKPLNVAAERRLSKAEFGGGPTEVLMFGNDREKADEAQVEIHERAQSVALSLRVIHFSYDSVQNRS